MRTIDYDEKDKNTGSTETHMATDTAMEKRDMNNALEEGFAASDGVRGITSASGGTVKHPEKADALRPDPVAESVEDENPGLADN